MGETGDGVTAATRAVVLARGLGTRMRADGPALTAEQAAVAATGLKAMIPIGHRPFLDYLLSALADAGFTDACVVIGPEHAAVPEYYARSTTPPRRIRVQFAVQHHPRGTADALLAARDFTGNERFLVLNADNYYPVEVLAAVRELPEPGLPGFERAALVASGQIPPERIASYALLDIGPEGYLREIVEKPDAAARVRFGQGGEVGAETFVSMNCWLFTQAIYGACREVAPSPRGELELPLAVQHAITALGLRFRVLRVHAEVLDLSRRRDVAAVAARLRDVRVDL